MSLTKNSLLSPLTAHMITLPVLNHLYMGIKTIPNHQCYSQRTNPLFLGPVICFVISWKMFEAITSCFMSVDDNVSTRNQTTPIISSMDIKHFKHTCDDVVDSHITYTLHGPPNILTTSNILGLSSLWIWRQR